jgi:pyruvate-formate lyase-activating enzyme
MNEDFTESIEDRVKKQATIDYLVPKPPFPRNMLIEISNRCNHKCTFCFNPSMTRRKGGMDPDFIRRILQEAYDCGVREVGFTATGESLMDKHLFDYFSLAKDIGYEYTYFSTNGALLNEKKIEQIFSSDLSSIKFSFNAGTRETYKYIHGRDDFDHVIAMIKAIDRERKARNLLLRLFVTCVVTEKNKDEQNNLQEILGDVVDKLIFAPEAKDVGPITAALDIVSPCAMVFNRIHLTYEGYLSACCTDFEGNLVVADLNTMPLKEAWESEIFQELRRRHITHAKDGALNGTLCAPCIAKRTMPFLPLKEALAQA